VSAPATRLFLPPSVELKAGLIRLGELLPGAFPLRTKHRDALPARIRELSEWLTSDRDSLPRDYMARPEHLSAYLHWFLPWNIYRQGRLLAGLQLDLAPGTRILDLGAGPLTFLQALWLTRPELRTRELSYLGLDRADPALKVGRKLFAGLTGGNCAAWSVRTDRAIAGAGRTPEADILVAANLLNEIERPGKTARSRSRGDGAAEGSGDSSADIMLERWERQVSANGAILLIEPGIRDAARQLSRLRQAALERGWKVQAPCPHTEDCPMPGRRNGPWCHFTFAPTGAPDWLVDLSRKARLPKERASLSFLLLTRGEDGPVRIAQPTPVAGERGLVRVVSETFALPGGNVGQYGCSARGQILLQMRDAPRGNTAGGASEPGDLLSVRWSEATGKDAKSGSLIVPVKRRKPDSRRRG